MFRRAFWFATGAAAGVWATTRVQRALRGLAPESLALRVTDRAVLAGHQLRDLAVDVRAGTAQRERELTAALGLAATPEPPAAPAARVPPAQTPRDLPGPPSDPTGHPTGNQTGTQTGNEDH